MLFIRATVCATHRPRGNSVAEEFQGTDRPTSAMARTTVNIQLIVQHRPGRKHLNADVLSRKSTIDKCLAITEKEDSFDMRLEQEKDQFLTRIKKWVVTDARPNIDRISTFDYEEKLLWARFEELGIVNGLLCLAEKSGMTSSSSKIIPPRHLRQEILIKYHEGIGGGHLGFEKLLLSSKNDFIGRE